MTAIEFKSVSFGYAAELLFRDFSLTVADGEFFGVIGPNGSGKTTLLRLIAALLLPAQGEVVIKGNALSRYSRRALARIIGFMPQENHFAFDFTVEEVVMMGRNPYLRRFQLPTKTDRERVRAAMEFTDTIALRDKGINQISGGERQRVVLARTLTQEPQILLLDEPASHLDIAHQRQLLSILTRLNQQGITIVFLAHDLNLAALACQRILLLDKGKPVACAAPREVITAGRIEQVYGVKPLIHPHPETGVPQILLPAP